jgi:ABC-type glutathione transport system ATPase component
MAAERPGPLVLVRALGVTYGRRGRFGRRAPDVHALDGIDLEVARGTTLALVGASGSGKSTLGRCLALLERPTRGELRLEDAECTSLPEGALRRLRPRTQLIFQDPGTALNPRLSAEDAVTEPLAIAGAVPRDERRRRARELMEQVGLSPDSSGRSCHAFSGGQRQRLAIARALAAGPRLLVLDEALSALDPSVQAQILDLLGALRSAHGLTYVHISHDLARIAPVADEVVVLDAGRIVERGPAARVLSRPEHPCTRAQVAPLAWA